MGSLSSNLLLAAVVLIIFDIIVFIACAVYYIYKRYQSNKRSKLPKKQQTVIFGDSLNLRTQAVPLNFDENESQLVKNGSHNYQWGQRGRSLSTSRSALSPVDFDPSMYIADPGNPNDKVLQSSSDLPSLQFSLLYNASLIELTVVLIRGKKFKIDEDNAESSNHILVSAILLPEGSIHHSSRGAPPNPFFQDKFSFFVSGDKLKNSQIKFNIWNIDKYSRKSPFGELVVSLDEIFHKDSPFGNKVDLCREITLKEHLMHETPKGEILLSLQYLPGAERVNITITKGRDIKLEEFDKDIYVKVSAVKSDIVIKNKKTSLMRKTAIPLFNETTSFQLYPHSSLTLDDTSIIISLCATRSRGPHRRLIGRAVVGPADIANEAGNDQWNRMMLNPHKVIAVWQQLH